MKTVIVFMMLSLFSTLSYAEEIPPFMKDGTILVTLKDGTQYVFSLNEYKVVKRGNKKKVEAPLQDNDTSENKPPQQAKNKNRVKVLGGTGPSGLKTTKRNDSATVELSNGAVGGVGYDRLVTDEISIGGQILSNGTYLLGIGFDF